MSRLLVLTLLLTLILLSAHALEDEPEQKTFLNFGQGLLSPVAPAKPGNVGIWSSIVSHMPVPGRPGLCPYVRRLLPTGSHHDHASMCGNFCVNDLQCMPGHKCCPTECGYACFAAVRGIH